MTDRVYVDYQVLGAPHLHELEARVHKYLDTGWEPIGGMVFQPFSPLAPAFYYQTIVKRVQR